MAESNMKELIAEVKKTNILLNKNVEQTEPEPVGADRALKEEQSRDAKSAMTDTFSKFLGAGSFLGKGFGKLSDGISNLIPGGAIKGILGTLGTVAVLGGLVAFLQSETWKNLKDVIIPKLATGLEEFKKVFTEFVNDLVAFFEDPSFKNLTELFTGDSSKFILGIAALTVLLKPLTSFKLLKLAVTGLVSAFGAISTGLTSLGAIFGVGGAAAAGTLLAIVAGVVLIGKGLYDSFMVFSSTFKETGSILESLKEAAIEFVGTIVGLPFDLLKDFTSYLSRKLGFESFADTLDSFSVEEIVKKSFRGFLTNIGKLGDLFINAFTPSPEFLERLSEMNPFSFIKKQVDNVKNLFTGVFTWMGTSVSEGSEWLTTLVNKGLIAAYDVVKNIFSTENLTVENFTSMFGNLFDMVTAPIKFAFDSIKSIFMPIGDSETNELKKEYSLSSLLGNVVEDVFNWFKNLFKFDVSQISLPEFPDLGAIIVDIFRKFAGSIASIGFNIPLYGKIQVGDYLPQSFMDFANKTGDYKSIAPSVPVRPAASVTPTTAGEAGRGGSPIIINQSTQSNTRQGDQFSLSKGITDNSFGAQIANTFAQ